MASLATELQQSGDVGERQPTALRRLAPPSQARILFLTRDPVFHAQSGSTTYILGMLQLLRAQGALVTVLSTAGSSRSPRLFFRRAVALPPGVFFRAPGYLRFGSWYLLLWSPKAWARTLVRLAARLSFLQSLAARVQRAYGDTLFAQAWDLTSPTPEETAVATQNTLRFKPTAVLANYCLWGPLLGSGRLGPARTAILMHDLLSARTARFAESGMPLDMPPISEAEELAWLAGAQTLLAAQTHEAKAVAQHLPGRVLVSPIVLPLRPTPAVATLDGRCLFVGSAIAPNQAALTLLLHEVWPRVRAIVPSATLAVAGTVSHAVPASAAAQGVLARGVVASLEAEYAHAAVCLVPLTLGTGVKIKLLEALSFGKAVVSTTVGNEGLEHLLGQPVCVADGADAFAAAVVYLLQNQAAREAQQNAACAAVEQHFGARRALDPDFLQALL